MTVEEILAQSRTKTWKIQQLILLGKTRNEIAALQVLGAYGAIQNVYAAMQRNGQIPTSTNTRTSSPTATTPSPRRTPRRNSRRTASVASVSCNSTNYANRSHSTATNGNSSTRKEKMQED